MGPVCVQLLLTLLQHGVASKELFTFGLSFKENRFALDLWHLVQALFILRVLNKVRVVAKNLRYLLLDVFLV